MSAERYYDEPRYYDIAFGWDHQAEVDFLAAAFAANAEGDVKSVLELGCGTGQWLLELSRRGYLVAGVDISRDMLEFARAKLAEVGLTAELFLKDMAEFSLYRRFDAAICMLATFSYLYPDERVRSHFRSVAQHLRPGGVYVIDLAIVPAGGQPEAAAQEWSSRRDQVSIHARWELIGPWDPASRTTSERLTLRGEERGWQRVWEQESLLKMYSLPEISAAAKEDGYFEVAAVYQGFDIAGQFGDDEAGGRALVVLRRTDKPTPRLEGAGEPAESQRRDTRRTRRPQGGNRSMNTGRRAGQEARGEKSDQGGGRRRPRQRRPQSSGQNVESRLPAVAPDGRPVPISGNEAPPRRKPHRRRRRAKRAAGAEQGQTGGGLPPQNDC